MGISLPSDVDSSKMRLQMRAVAEEDEDVEDQFGQMSLNDSPQLDANVAFQQSWKDGGISRDTGPMFTRSWSFVEPAEDRKVKLEEVRRSKNVDLKLDVKRALSRTWSFTNTQRSPLPQSVTANFMDFVAVDENDKETVQQVQELKKAATPKPVPPTPIPSTPMPRISEDEDEDTSAHGVLEEEEEEEEVKSQYTVKPLVKSLVVPSEHTEQHWLHLSNLDRVVNPTFSSVIHYYKDVVNEERTFSDTTKVLKDSLAKTLVDFYPLAGRLALSDEGKVDLHCNDAGAVWIEAAVDKRLDEIGGPQPNHRLSGFDVARLGPGPIYIPDQITPMPVLLIQATKFACGSVAIATSWHHTVADGFSGTHFMRSWAEVAQGKPISVKPVHTRELLKPREAPNPTLVNGYTSSYLDKDSYVEAKVSTSAPTKLEKFDLNKEAIAQLKKTANLEPPPFTPRPFTSAESISAHLWRQMTKARATANSYEAESAKGQPTKFFMFVDGRKRLRLPPGYFGNVVCSACAEAKEADILQKPLHYAASLIRIATRNITEEYFRSLIDWVELQGMSSSKSEHVNSLGHDVAATFWTFFPLYDVEFGWGRPIFAARNSPPRPLIDGIAMLPSAEGQGMVALLNLHSDRMSKLQRQISFATVFH